MSFETNTDFGIEDQKEIAKEHQIEAQRKKNIERANLIMSKDKVERGEGNEAEILMFLKNRIDHAENFSDLVKITAGKWFKGMRKDYKEGMKRGKERKDVYYKNYKVGRLLTDRMWYGEFKAPRDNENTGELLTLKTPTAFGFDKKIEEFLGKGDETPETRDAMRRLVEKRTKATKNLEDFFSIILKFGGVAREDGDTTSYMDIVDGVERIIKQKGGGDSIKWITKTCDLRKTVVPLTKGVNIEEWKKIREKITS